MASSLTIRQAQMVLPNRVVVGDLVIEDGVIIDIAPHTQMARGEVIDAEGLTLIPGLIDGDVVFSRPNESFEDSMRMGTRAAAAGGVTSVVAMPSPSHVITPDNLHDYVTSATGQAYVNYGFCVHADHRHIQHVTAKDGAMGARVNPSKAGVFERGESALEHLFSHAQLPLHFVSEDPIRLHERRLLYPDSQHIKDHAKIYDPRTASDAAATAIALSIHYGVRLHLLQVSSEEEVQLLNRHQSDQISAAVSLSHLLLHAKQLDASTASRPYLTPPIRSERHHHALWTAMKSGLITCLTSGHRPIHSDEQALGYPSAPAGYPGIESSLSLCLDLVSQGRLTLHEMVSWWCEGPAVAHKLPRKGKLEVGYDGDVVLVDCNATHTISASTLHTHCGWSPWESQTFRGKPVLTAIGGRPVFRDNDLSSPPIGKPLYHAN